MKDLHHLFWDIPIVTNNLRAKDMDCVCERKNVAHIIKSFTETENVANADFGFKIYCFPGIPSDLH